MCYIAAVRQGHTVTSRVYNSIFSILWNVAVVCLVHVFYEAKVCKTLPREHRYFDKQLLDHSRDIIVSHNRNFLASEVYRTFTNLYNVDLTNDTVYQTNQYEMPA